MTIIQQCLIGKCRIVFEKYQLFLDKPIFLLKNVKPIFTVTKQ